MQAAIERMKRDTQAVTDIAATFLFYHIRVVGTKRLLVDGQGAVDTSAALYAFLFSIALETAAMFAMMVAYSTPKVVTASPASVLQEPKAQPSQQSAIGKEEKPSNVVALVSSNPPAVSIIEFATNALVRKLGAMNESDDFYLAHWRHCKAVDGRDMAPTEAVRQRTTLRRMR